MAEQATYPNAQAAVDALRPGWRVTGERDYYVTVPNEGAGANEPQTISKKAGTIYSVMGPNGSPDEIILGPSDKTVVWNTTPGAPLPKALVVIKGPSKDLSTGGGQASDPSAWTPVYRIPGDASSGLVAQWDPVNKEYHPVAAAAGAQPTGKYDPVYREPNKPESGVIALVDTGDKSFHPVAGEPGAKPSGQYSNVTDPRDPTGKRIIGMVDTGSKTFHPLAQDPSTQKNFIQTPTAVYSVDVDNNVKKLIDIDRSSPYQAVVIDGIPYRFDPNEKDPTKAFTKAPGDWEHPPIKDANGLTMTWDEAQGKYAYPPGVKPAATLSTITTAPFLEWYDAEGNLLKRVPNENYRPAAAVAPAPNTTAPRILIPDPDKPGQLKWIDNEGRVTASQALTNLAAGLSGQVIDGKISVDEAKEIISGANTAMTTAVTAASQVLDYTAEGARTGAGLLQQRAATAQGMLGNVLGIAGQGQPSGRYGGGLQSVPAGIGPALVGGIQGWTADLMGGQSTLDAAARMVQAAAPGSDASSPAAATAIGTLTQMLDRFKSLTGADHPIVQGQRAAQESAVAKGVVAPVPSTAPSAAAVAAAQPATFTAPDWQRADQMFGGAPAGNALAAPGVAGAVPPGSPMYLGTGNFTAPDMPRQATPTIVMNF